MILGGHILFWGYNVIDATFLDWKNVNVAFRMDNNNNQLVVLNYKF